LALEEGNLATCWKGTKIWDTNNNFKCIKHKCFDIFYEHIGNLHLLPSGDIICIASRDTIIIILDRKDDLNFKHFIVAHSDSINCLINLTNNKIASGCGSSHDCENSVKIWKIGNGLECLKVLNHDGQVFSLLFVEKYDLLISASLDKTICV
jgi:WD40 repeat protein